MWEQPLTVDVIANNFILHNIVIRQFVTFFSDRHSIKPFLNCIFFTNRGGHKVLFINNSGLKYACAVNKSFKNILLVNKKKLAC